MGEHGSKQIIIGYRVRDAEGIFRFVWRQDAKNAIPVHGPEDFDPLAAGREVALEEEKLKEQIARWRGIQQSLKDRPPSRENELALVKLVETWLGDLVSQAG